MDGGQLPAAGRPVWVRVSGCRRARIFAAKLNKMLKNRANSCKIRSVFFLRKKNTILLRFVHFFKKCGKIGGFQWERPARSRYGVPYIDRFWCTCSSTSVCASLSCRSQKRLCSKSTQNPQKYNFAGFCTLFAKTWQNRRISMGASRPPSV